MQVHGWTRLTRLDTRILARFSPSVTLMLSAFAAPLFVFLWSTGFIVARAITPYVDPAKLWAVQLAGFGVALIGAWCRRAGNSRAAQSTVSAPAGVFARAAAPGPGGHAGRALRAVSTTTR